jgi:DNA-binding CsgD family transcriptional regulator
LDTGSGEHLGGPGAALPVVEAYLSGKSLREVGALFGLHREQVRQILIKEGVPCRPGVHRPGLPKNEILRAYAAGATLQELADKYGVTPGAVGYYVRQAGLSRKPGPKVHHFRPSERFLEVLDGLLLGDGCLCVAGRQTPIYTMTQKRTALEWVNLIGEEFTQVGLTYKVEPQKKRPQYVQLRTLAYVEFRAEYERWYPVPAPDEKRRKRVPADVRLGPLALMHWYAGDGTLASNGYAARFCTHSFPASDVELLRARLGELYGWKPEVFPDGPYNVLRLSRSGDRLGLRSVVAPWMPRCFRYKLALKESAPCSEEEAQRRRSPGRLDAGSAAAIRERARAGERYADIAVDFGVNERTVGKVARGEVWKDGSEPIMRHKAPRRLTREEVADVLRRLESGQSQAQIEREMGIPQPRVSWLKKRAEL